MRVSKKLLAVAMTAALVFTSSISAFAASTTKYISNGVATVTCITYGADAVITSYDAGYTVWARVTPYDTSGVAIYGTERQALKTVTAPYSGTKALSKAIGAFRILNVVSTFTVTDYVG